jgi:hypothetical protein
MNFPSIGNDLNIFNDFVTNFDFDILKVKNFLIQLDKQFKKENISSTLIKLYV